MNKVEVGKRIMAIRSAQGMTQAEFGRKIGRVSGPSVSHWENGRSLPTKRRLYQIAKLGGVNLHELKGVEPADNSNMVSQRVLGKRIERIRNEAGFDRTEFAELLDVSNLTITNWESGKNMPQRANLEKIVDLADLDMESLLFRQTPTKATKKSQPTKVQASAPVATAEPISINKQPLAIPAQPVTEEPNLDLLVKKRTAIPASQVIENQLEDEFMSFENRLKKKDKEEIIREAKRIDIYVMAKEAIRNRIKNKKASPLIYLGKNSILAKFYEFFMNNPFRGINDDTFEDFEEALETVYSPV